MPEITTSLVKELREKTGVGMMDCKNALVENNGDIESSIDWLRAKGIAKAAKKEGRIASEGLIHICKGENKSSIIEVNSALCANARLIPSTIRSTIFIFSLLILTRQSIRIPLFWSSFNIFELTSIYFSLSFFEPVIDMVSPEYEFNFKE